MRRVVLALAALLLVAGGAAGAWYYHDQTRTREKKGSSTVEFTPKPAAKKRAKRSLETIPWPMYGYDPARTRDPIQFHVRPPFKKIWTLRVGNIVEFPPVVGYGLLFVNQYRGRLFAVNAATGQRQWRRRWLHCAAASPAVGKDILYVAYMQPYPCNRYPRSQPGFLAAIWIRNTRGVLQKRTKVLWRFRTGAIESSPLLVNNVLYFGSWNHSVYALDVSEQRHPRLLWRFRADDEVNGSPAYGGGLVYFGSNSGSMYAVKARTGRLVWRSRSYSRFGRREQFYATPTVAYGRVYAGNTDGTVYAFGAGTGHLLWANHVGSYVYTGPAVWNKKIYVGTYDGHMLALNAASGATVWRHEAPAAIHGAPTVLSGIVYFSTCPNCGSHGSRHAKSGPRGTFGLDANTGRLVWRFADGQYSPVVADSDRIYVVGRTHVYGFEPLRKHKAKKQTSKRP